MDTKDTVWKFIASGLLGIVIAGSSFYLTYGQHAISRADATELVDSKINQSDYSKDKRSIMEFLDRNNRSLEENTKQIIDLKVQTTKIEQKTDDLGEQMRTVIKHLRPNDAK